MQLAPIIAQLQAKVPALQFVGGAANLASLKTNAAVKTPAAFVIPVSENPRPNSTAGAVVQLVDERFGVVIWAKDVSDPRGEAAYDSGLAAIKSAVITALIGWQPDSTRMMCTEASGHAIDFINGSIWWQQDFMTSRIDRSA